MAEKGYCKVAAALLAAGAVASLSAKTVPDGETPLSLACRNGHREMVELLISSGAPVTLPAGKGAAIGCAGPNIFSLIRDPDMLQSIIDPDRACTVAEKYGLPSSKFMHTNGFPADPSIPAHEDDRPYFPLRNASTALLERAIDYLRKNIGAERIKQRIYPVELLSDDERILVLARVAEAMAGYGHCDRSALYESMVYLMYKSVSIALEDEAQGITETLRGHDKEDTLETISWRKMVMRAYQHEVCSIRFSGVELLDVDYDALPPGFWIFDFGFDSLDSGFWILDFGFWI